LINCVVVSNALKSVHSVFSGCFSWLDVITMPSGPDIMALHACKHACGHALTARSCPRSGRITSHLGPPPHGAVAARLATSHCPRLLSLPRVAATLRAMPQLRRCHCHRIAVLCCATGPPRHCTHEAEPPSPCHLWHCGTRATPTSSTCHQLVPTVVAPIASTASHQASTGRALTASPPSPAPPLSSSLLSPPSHASPLACEKPFPINSMCLRLRSHVLSLPAPTQT